MELLEGATLDLLVRQFGPAPARVVIPDSDLRFVEKRTKVIHAT